MISSRYLFLCLLLQHHALSIALASLDLRSVTGKYINRFQSSQRCLGLRGGDEENVETDKYEIREDRSRKYLPALSSTILAGAVQQYSSSLKSYPVATKSVTAGCIFALSDCIAQRIEKRGNKSKQYDKKRTIAASLVGILYFGPAAHFWYENIFKVFPGTSMVSTLQKAVAGQLIFGPTFTIVFFATSLVQSGNFTFGNWFRKIQSDLAGAWFAGVGFWPLVDLVSYSLVPPRWIPLFVNVCSLIWNVYLSIIANRKAKIAKA